MFFQVDSRFVNLSAISGPSKCLTKSISVFIYAQTFLKFNKVNSKMLLQFPMLIFYVLVDWETGLFIFKIRFDYFFDNNNFLVIRKQRKAIKKWTGNQIVESVDESNLICVLNSNICRSISMYQFQMESLFPRTKRAMSVFTCHIESCIRVFISALTSSLFSFNVAFRVYSFSSVFIL